LKTLEDIIFLITFIFVWFVFLRYAREIEGIGQVVALDNDKDVSRIFHHKKKSLVHIVLQFYSIGLDFRTQKRALPYVVKAAYIVTIGPHFVSGQLLVTDFLSV